VSDAVQASCSAYPFFERKTVKTDNGDLIELIDGGYATVKFRAVYSTSSSYMLKATVRYFM
jgi:hypothetical protein